jgi:stalled ribosome rescue protein Dom34
MRHQHDARSIRERLPKERLMQQMAMWIDHDEARVFHVDGETSDESTFKSAQHHIHRHPADQNTRTHNHPQDEPVFFAQVIGALEGAEKILIMGPSVTKLHFLKYAQEHAKAVASHIVGLESADHPTDPQLVAHVRQYFHSEQPRKSLTR